MPATQPPRAGVAPSDELRRLQSELDALSRVQGVAAEPVPTTSDSIAERVKLKERLIELIGEVALHEDRWAVDVLNDMLCQPVDSASSNGPAVPTKAEPVRK